MKYYLIRHGQAGHAQTDALRPLTDEGRQQAQRNGVFLKMLGIQPTAIYTSPRKRAQQTAHYIGTALNCQPIVDDAVNFDFTIEKAHQLASQHAPDSRIIFVGHNPSITQVVNDLTGTRTEMSPCSMAYVKDVNTSYAHSAILKWLMTPKILKAVLQS